MHHLPRRQSWVGGWVPVCGQLAWLEKANLAALGCQGYPHPPCPDAGVLGLRERLGHAVLALGEARLLEPGQCPAAVGVEVALLLGQRFVESLVDERQRVAHRERLALGVEHLA